MEQRARFLELMNSGDHTVPDAKWDHACGSLSNRSAGQSTLQDQSVCTADTSTSDQPRSPSALQMKDERVLIKEQVLTNGLSGSAVLDGASSRTFSRVKTLLLSSGTSNGWVAVHVRTRAFTFITASVIVINALFVGIVAQSEMRAAIAEYHGEVPNQVFSDDFAHYTSMFFTFAILLESFLRVVHMQWFFIFGAGRYWNFLDVFFITAGFLEMAVRGREAFEVNYLRALRLLRLLRAATFLRYEPVFGRLRLMMLASEGCLHYLLWVVVLLAFSMYLFAVVFLNTDTMTRFFGSVHMTLLTPVMCVLGRVSSWEAERTFLNVSPFCSVVLLLCVALMVLALFNHRDGRVRQRFHRRCSK